MVRTECVLFRVWEFRCPGRTFLETQIFVLTQRAQSFGLEGTCTVTACLLWSSDFAKTQQGVTVSSESTEPGVLFINCPIIIGEVTRFSDDHLFGNEENLLLAFSVFFTEHGASPGDRPFDRGRKFLFFIFSLCESKMFSCCKSSPVLPDRLQDAKSVCRLEQIALCADGLSPRVEVDHVFSHGGAKNNWVQVLSEPGPTSIQ